MKDVLKRAFGNDIVIIGTSVSILLCWVAYLIATDDIQTHNINYFTTCYLEAAASAC
jgi:hypothetical protein